MNRQCKTCGDTFEQVGRGRPRQWCAECSPPRLGYVPAPLRAMTCEGCGAEFQATHSRRHCSRQCGNRARRQVTTCSVCGVEVWRSRTSASVQTCLACKRANPKAKPKHVPQQRACPGCGESFQTRSKNHVYCSKGCRPPGFGRRPPATTRGYGTEHRQLRDRWKSLIESAGWAPCCLCDEPIESSEPWHLDHTPERDDYRGIAHAMCNLRDGAKRGRERRGDGVDRPWLERDYHPCPTCGQSVTWASQRCCSRRCATALAATTKPPRTVRQAPPDRPCRICSAPFTPMSHAATYCSDDCRVEKNRRVQRDKYRARVGLPVDPSEPTSKWRLLSK